jgi:hypothetical protein
MITATFRERRMTFLSAHGGRAALVPRIMPRRAETALKTARAVRRPRDPGGRASLTDMADRKIAAAVVMTAAAVSAAGLGTDTPPGRGKSVRLQITGYRPAPAVVVRSYGVASHGISRSRWSAGGVFGLAPSSLTELVLRPAGSR